MAIHTAQRLLRRHPQIARDSFFTAIVCGDLDAVERVLAERPEAASERGGPKNWEPLLYLAFTRLSLAASSANAVAIARSLLDHGASPKAYFMAGDSAYTPLVGVIGEGEEDRPPHPRRDELARLLLERGAEPYDMQVVYNIHFHGKILWFMRLMYEFAITAGRHADWDDAEWHMLDMGGYGSGARWHLWVAIEHDDIELADWCLTHGATPNAAPARDARFSKRSLYEDALRVGLTDLAELLVRHGARRETPAFGDDDRFSAACFRLDRESARALVAQHPEYLRSSATMFAAAQRDRADVVDFLLELGVPPNVEDQNKQRPLHVAGYHGSQRVAELLIPRGAEVDARESRYGSTALGFAVHAQQQPMIELLSRHSRDVWNLAGTGNVERLRDVLAAEPHLATLAHPDGETPLMRLPEDETRAIAIVRLLVAHHADPARRDGDGRTAADIAARRGMVDVAELLMAR